MPGHDPVMHWTWFALLLLCLLPLLVPQRSRPRRRVVRAADVAATMQAGPALHRDR
jgi:hypothetical protein